MLKTILIISLSDKKDRLSEERDARKKILPEEKTDQKVCIEFYYPDPNDHGRINSVLQKRKPQIVVFNCCCHDTIHRYHRIIISKIGKGLTFFHKYTSGVLDDEVRKNLTPIKDFGELKSSPQMAVI